MNILDFQTKIADTLNTVEELLQGGCKALAEDSLSIVHDVETQLQQATGVAIVVTTPRLTRNGCAADSLPCDAALEIRCVELPALNRETPGHLTALDAAEIVSASLDGSEFNFTGIDQRIDERTGTITATVSFNTQIIL